MKNRFQVLKRVLSLIMVFAMVIGFVPNVASAAEQTKTVYFQNNWLWTDVCAYTFDSATNQYIGSAWPGAKMELVENDGTYDIYKAEVPVGITGLIFNGIKNDGSGNRDQTPDIKGNQIVAENQCYYMVWNNGNAFGTYAYTPPVVEYNVQITLNDLIKTAGELKAVKGEDYTASFEAPDGFNLPETIEVKVGGTVISGYTYANGTVTIPASAVTGDIAITAAGVEIPQGVTAYCVDSSSWENVAAYAWVTNGESMVWPGVAMTKTADKVHGFDVYSIHFDTQYNNIIFNNGSSQTDDLTLENGKYYDLASAKWYNSLDEIPAPAPAPVVKDYYLFGYINGANYGCEEDAANLGEYKFVDGKLTATFTRDSYVAVKTGDNAEWYMTDGWQGEVTSVSLYDTTTLGTTADKLLVPGGTEWEFTLVENADGSLTLSYAEKQAPSKDYYLIGYINGADYGCQDDYANMGEYKFVDGKLTATFTQDSYVFVKTADNAAWYMTQGYPGDSATSATLYNTANSIPDANKLRVPGGVEITFTLTEGEGDTLTLSYAEKQAPAAKDYYLIGSINGADYGCNDDWQNLGEYKFVDGKLTATFTADSYVFVKTGDNAEWFMAESYISTKSGTFKHTSTGTSEKMLVPAGTEWEFTLVENADGSLTLSYAEKQAPAAKDYYLIGSINGADYGCNDDWQNLGEYKFVDGKLTATFTADSYVFVKTGDNAEWFMAESYISTNSGTFKHTSTGTSEKMLVPAGTEWEFTLVENADGSLTLSYAEKQAPAAKDYYLIGSINGADYGCNDDWQNLGEYKFVDGKLTATFTADSYVFVKTGDNAEWFMAESYISTNSGTFKNTSTGTSEKMLVPAGTEWEFTLVENADGSLTLSYAEPVKADTYTVIFHFANTVGWSPVNLYVWGSASTGSWPGAAMTKVDENGYQTMTVTATSSADINYIFNNGANQTIDLALAADLFDETTKTAEVWIELDSTPNASGKYVLKQIKDEPLDDVLLAVSPRVNGTSVTFEFAAPAGATSVDVRGTFTDEVWTPVAMTKNARGLYTVTVEDLEPGIYEYKFVVNNTDWYTDPANGKTNAEGNSVFTILDPDAEDTNIVKIHVFYNRADGIYFQEDVDGDMDGTWNISVWGDGLASQRYDFAADTTDLDGNGDTAQMVTTIPVVGRDTAYVAMKPRMSTDTKEWFREESEARVELDNIVSGTIFLYIDSNGQDGKAGNMSYSVITGTDIVTANKVTGASYDYEKNTVVVTMLETLDGNGAELQVVDNRNNPDTSIVSAVKASGNTYTLTLNKELSLNEVGNYKVKYDGYYYDIAMDDVYASDKFAQQYTYEGTDLGANHSVEQTTFKVWAPTASSVNVVLYSTGSDREAGAADLGSYEMTGGTADDKGVWTVTVEGNLHGVYYTYEVTVNRETVEAVDPYARAVGVNGERGMVIHLDYTDPDGWASDANPNPVSSQTDAVIYELHVRDFSIDASSGISEANRGKYLAFTEEGTTVNGEGNTISGVDYLEQLGITHLHLLPVYDYGSVDETRLNVPQFNWGYDPVNYNVPEGSYSSNPYDGTVRVNEFKQMVQSLHNNGISVVMDVVYNHVYNADQFCFNNIVPGYFSRPNSSASGCGNDTASEREMVRKYIVESVKYWADEYHIDGFRFDLVGLLDVDTINAIVTEVHKTHPNVIFYGEGWDMDSTNKEPGTQMAKQHNADLTPGFAYFSDSMRNNLAGDNGNSRGFASGAGNGAAIAGDWMANAMSWGSVWSTNPQQVVQYVSCHDNYTLADKLIISTNATGVNENIIKMNNLSAAFYMTAQGLPFIHAGEEILREKVDENGSRAHNSYNASDFVNHIKWEDVETYADNVAYYQGLIAFRAANPALRYVSSDLVSSNVQALTTEAKLLVFRVDANGTASTEDEDILVIFNANQSAKTVELPEGEWTIYVDGEKAGTTALGTAEGTVDVEGISAMVLTTEDKGEDPKAPLAASGEKTIYFTNNQGWEKVYAYAWTTGANGEQVYLLGTWGGTEATFSHNNDYSQPVYKITIPASETGVEGLIFHSGKGGNDNQTVDIVPGPDGTGYYPTEKNEEDKWKVDSWTEHPPRLGDADEYFLIGWINNADYADADYKFDENGQVTVKFDVDSYVYVINGDNSETYMTDGYQGAVTSAILKDIEKHTMTADKWDKLLIPGGAEVTVTMVKNNDNTVTLSYVSNVSGVTDTTGIQDGVTLHCWNWSFAEIEKNMEEIAKLGFTAIQTSPIQPLKEATNLETNSVGSHWWVYYQPVDFVITDDAGNALGTKEDLVSMIETAHSYGVQVIVDVVANHLGNKTGNDLAERIPNYLRKDEYWHDINTDISDWNDRYDMTQNCLDGLPDLNTANDDIQGYVLDFLKECIDAGVDGFRFDMAKSIETPSDDDSFASDFWPTVIGGAETYAAGKGKDVYMYGEVLDTAAINISAYTQYMSVTDNSWGNDLRSRVAAGAANMVAGYHKAADASNLVIWAESHDTFANNDSSGVSEEAINMTWALVAARADAMGLYLARPESLTQDIGEASSTGWDNIEVGQVNKFHNVFHGQDEYIANEGTISYVERGTSGVILVNVEGTACDVEVTANKIADGTYTDHITGNTFTVAEGKITGKIGDTGIAVVYNVAKYTITVEETTGGSVEASAEEAEAGKTITITVTADDGKELDTVTVTGEDDAEITLTNLGNGQYSFIQPAQDVTVAASFKDVAEEEKFQVTIGDTLSGKVEISTSNPAAGEKVTITTNPDEGCEVKSVTVKDAAGNKLTVTDNGNGTYTFTQPAGNVTVEVVFQANYKFTKGDGSSAEIGASTDLTFTVNGAFSKFTGIEVDGKKVETSNYDAKAGSTIITLKASYLKTLAEGDHTITVIFTDGEAEGSFKLTKAKNETSNNGGNNGQPSNDSANTGDGTNVLLLSVVATFSAMALVVLLQEKKRKAAR